MIRRLLLLATLALAATAAAAFPSSALAVQKVEAPTVTIAPFEPTARPLAGSSVTTTVTFDNDDSTGATGYGPYVEILFDSRGDDDGDGGKDGLSLTGIQMAGASLVTTTIDCDTDLPANHPFHRTTLGQPYPLTAVDCPAGRTLVVAALPFGSFTKDQPSARIALEFATSMNYDMSGPLAVDVQGGYRFGGDELDNPTSDDPVRGNSADGTALQPKSASVDPVVMRLDKEYVGPENETATGPSYPRSYELRLDVATGQLVSTPTLQDHLPRNVVVTSVVVSNGGSVTSPQFQPGSLPAKVGAANELTVGWPASITGAPGVDRTVTVNFYVPYLDTTGSELLPAGDDRIFDNPTGGTVTASGMWTPVDPSDPGPVPVQAVFEDESGAPAVERFHGDSIVIQKHGPVSVVDTTPAGLSPGDVLEYTFDVQVSDYYAVNGITITDTLRDGLRRDASFVPTVVLAGQQAASGTFTGANLVDTVANDDTILFDVSGALGLGATPLRGGCVPVGGVADPDVAFAGLGGCSAPSGATTLTITYRAIVEDAYAATGLPVRSGDSIHNDVDVDATAHTAETGFSPLGPVGDDSEAEDEIARGTVEKKVYAVNGTPVGPGTPEVRPGDLVTYYVAYSMPFATVKDLVVEDYLPLPVHDASTVTTLDTAVDNAIPAVGHVRFVSGIPGLKNDTFSGPAGYRGAWPALTSFGPTTGNFFRLDYGSTSVVKQDSVVSLLATVRVSNKPFADGMLLTNQAEARTGNTPGDVVRSDAYANIELREPDVQVRKGVAATSSGSAVFAPAGPLPGGAAVGVPGGAASVSGITAANAAQIDSNVSNLDAGDVVRYAVTWRNVGGAAANNVEICDTLQAAPTMFDPGVTNFSVTYGNGDPVTFTGSQADFFDCTTGITVTSVLDGMEDDPVPAAGHDVIVVVYDRTVTATAQDANLDIPNVGQLNQFTTELGSDGFLDVNEFRTDPATARTSVNPAVAKSITASSAGHTTPNSSPTIGERVTYTVTITLREGTLTNAVFRDVLANGLEFASPAALTSITADAGITMTAGTLGSETYPSARTMRLALGDVTNVVAPGTRTITLTYDVVVRDVAAAPNNAHGATRANAVTLTHDDCSTPATGLVPACATATTTATLQEPNPTLTKGVALTQGGTPGASVDLDAGDSAWWTITAGNAAGRPIAYDAVVTDVIPTGLDYASGTLSVDGVPVACDGPLDGVVPFAGGDCEWVDATHLRVRFDTLVAGSPHAIKYRTDVDTLVAQTGLDMQNDADLTAYSLPSTHVTPACQHALTDCHRRTYTRAADATATIRMARPTKTLVSTSAPDAITAGSNVVVGERATYEVTVFVPEGTTKDLKVLDTLDPGLVFTQTPITVTKVSFANPTVPANPSATVPAFTNSGRTLTLDFGDFVNNDSDPEVESLVIRYEVQTTNVVGNQAGTSIGNGASVTFTPPTGGTTTLTPPTLPADLVVREPAVTVGKVLSREDVGAQSYVKVVVTATNSGAANTTAAFDLTLRDDLTGTGLTYVSAPVAVAPTCTFSGSAHACSTGFASPVASADVDQLDPGQTVTWTFYTQLATGYQVGASVDNEARGEWTSLPPAQHPSGNCVAGVPAADCTERTGTGTGPNDYFDEDDDTLAPLAPSMTKALVTTSQAHTTGQDVVVGETATYRLVVTVPEGVTNQLVVADTLDDGLVLVNAAPTITGAFDTAPVPVFTGVTPAYSNSGRTMTLNFGSVDNRDRDPGAETITIEYQVLVSNATNVNAATTHGNGAGATYLPDGGATTPFAPPSLPADLVVVEPVIAVAKTMTRVTLGGNPYVRIVATAQNTGSVDAFDVTLRDNLAGRHLTYAPSQPPTCTFAPAGGTCTPGVSGTVAGADVTRLDAGQTVTWTFYATEDATSVAGVQVANAVRGEWTSIPGTLGVTCVTGTPANVCSERTGTEAPAQNDYTDSDSASLPALEPSISKTIVDSSLASTTPHSSPAVGERVRYALVVTVPAGTTRDLEVRDTLDDGLAFAADAAPTEVAIGSSWATGTPANPATNPAFSTTGGGLHHMVLQLGDVVNDTGVAQTVTIRYWAVVRNAAGVNRGTTADNAAELWRNANATGGSATKVGTDVKAGPVTVVEPELNITKTISPTLVDAGQPATVTLVVEHTAASDAVAYGLDVNDPLPVEMTRSAAPITCAPLTVTCDSTASTPTHVNVKIAELGLGDTVTITVPVTMSPALAAGATVSNTAYVDWRSQPDLPGYEVPCAAGFTDCATRTGDYTAPDPVDDYSDNSTAVTTGATTSTLSGHVWHDVNNDGVRDPSPLVEPWIPNVTITLRGRDLLGNVVNLTTTTDVNGYYEFTGLRPSDADGYELVQTQPAGWIDGRDSLGDIQLSGGGAATGNRGVAANDRFHSIVLKAGESTEGTNYDFGELLPASLAGNVWGEENGGPENGVYDAGDDTQLANVTITLTGTDDLGQPVSRTATTDPSGHYEFTNLRPGTYAVVQTQPADWATGGENLGTGATVQGTNPGSNRMQGIELLQDQDGVDYDFWEIVRVDLAITKEIVPTRPAGGVVGVNTSFTWRVKLVNNGPSAATNVHFQDDLQALAEQYLVVTKVEPQAGTTCGAWTQVASPNLDCTTAALARGASTWVDLTVRVDGKPTVAPENLVNDVRISGADQVDTDPTNDQDTDEVVSRGGDVGVVKTGSTNAASVGDRFTWTLTVTNNGPGADPNVTLHDQLPPRALLEKVTASKGTCATTGVTGAAVDCTLGAMAPGEVVTITLDVLATEAGNYRNTVTITPGGIDENPANNTSEHTVVVTVPGAGECTVEGDGTIDGGEGDQVICGGPGPDIIECGTGSNTIIGGGGNDVISCVGSCTGANTILGGSGNDVIRVDCGGSTIDGGSGDDTITVPGSGAYTLCGGSGNDTIRGGSGRDLVDGGPGNDTVDGRGGNDRIYGGLGRDVLRGGSGNDAIYGGAGNDSLFGDAGNDLLFGENGTDQLTGGTGRDKAHGGNGNDTFWMVDRAVDLVIGGRGRDTLHRDKRKDRWTSIERVR